MKTFTDRDAVPEKARAILSSAVRVIAARGFEATRIEEVAREAGVGKGTVYEYFDSKEELFERAVEYATRMYLDMLLEALESGSDLESSLRNVIVASLAFCETNRHPARVLLDNPAGRAGESVRDWVMGFRREMVAAIVYTIKTHRGGDFSHDPEVSANIFLGALNNLSLARLLDDPEAGEPISDVADRALDVLLEGLGRE